ncbi:YhcN/YlaJ family sporulation lipoprotein [Paenibacillus sp. BSR1-1]|uniref:YhcN/YlaJ family sporulation lipoprotein n=1 Tax=Paenibacillus sp. BSR1-1 TaxID=3020845 RepID=UPI0025AEE4C6|nr:YhcN/YlaJ family sporulation lipoprotein [Paenibacillus sp. BSR1-1]MDN3020196.1 YhcN/YlaJ family sporulation lipoprotein [Paenibacillus sp. BSR1-1]
MNKKQWMIPLSAVMMMGLAGCNNDNNNAGANKGSNNLARPMGYYSNENHPNSNYGFLRDNDGAFTEMMDHTLGNEDGIVNNQKRKLLQTRDENGNPKNPTTPLAETDRNFFQRDNRFSTSDMNYHGHLNKNIGKNGEATDKHVQENITDNIRSKVSSIDNVQSVRSVAYGNTVIVSVNLVDRDREAATKRAIKNAVKPFANGKSVTVITDEGTFGRDRNINNDVPQRQPKANKDRRQNEEVPNRYSK